MAGSGRPGCQSVKWSLTFPPYLGDSLMTSEITGIVWDQTNSVKSVTVNLSF